MLALLALPALAQTRGAPPPRVDPAYLDYLEQLGELDLLPPITPPQGQLFDGMVGVRDVDGVEVGRVLVGGVMPTTQELWFMPEPLSPGEEFGFVHLDTYEQGTEGNELEAWNPDWDLEPCYVQNVSYKQVPNVTLTAGLDYSDDVDRWHFLLLQDGVLVGRMLREHHHVPNATEKYVDHWAFFDWYAFPKDPGDTLDVVLADTQFGTTTAFFDSLWLGQDIWLGFAQVQYTRKVGWQCLAHWSF